MRKILGLLILVVVSSQAHAVDSQCVPTKTVEQAKAELVLGQHKLDRNLAADYQLAQQELFNTYNKAAADYKNNTQNIELKYEQEVAQIRRNLNSGWDLEIEKAAARYNESLNQEGLNYRMTCDVALSRHNEAVENARIKYNLSSQVLAENYNRAVCAK